MTTSTRFAVGMSAATFALGLALNLTLVSAAFANDPMSLDIDFRNSAAGHGGDKSTTVRESAPAKDTRKKDNGLKSYGSSK